jgi:Acetyltransferase (GNAT) domain
VDADRLPEPLRAGEGWPHADSYDGLRSATVDSYAWLITLEHVVIGDCGTHGTADEDGDIEIGYGLAEPYRHRGYGGSIVPPLTAWLLARPEVRRVVAGRERPGSVGYWGMSHHGSWSSAGLAIVIEEKVFAEYGLFALQSQYTAEVAFALGVPEAGRLLSAGRGGAVFQSGGPDHYAEVRVELWPLRPSVTASEWDGVDEAQLDTSGTELRLASPTAGVSVRPLLLPAPGGYRVRAAAAGRDAARARGGSGPPYPSGLERWLIQLWPA